MTEPLDVSKLVIHNSPDVRAWAPTATISLLEFRADGVHLEFDKQASWPDVTPPGWSGPLQYTLWICMNIGGTWHAAGVIEYWRGLQASGGNVILDSQIAKNWTYDCGPMARQPEPGEPVGFFVTAGDARKKDVHAVAERSAVVVVPFPHVLPTSYHPYAPATPPAPSPAVEPQADPLAALKAQLDRIEAAVTKPAPVYDGPYGITLTPRP